MMQEEVLVSVVLPISGNPIYLEETVESVINQTYKNLEILAILNNAEEWVMDTLLQIQIHESRLKVIETSRVGISSALNLGIEKARGKYICRIDSDDLMYKHRIECQVEYLEYNPLTGVLGSQITKIQENGIEIGHSSYPTKYTEIAKVIEIRNCVAHPSVMFRRDLFKSTPAYLSEFDGIEDYELWMRLKDVTRIENTETELTKYRIWNQQYTQKSKRRMNLLLILARYKSILGPLSFNPKDLTDEALKRNVEITKKQAIIKLLKTGNFCKFLRLQSIEFLNAGINEVTRFPKINFHSLLGSIKILISFLFAPIVVVDFAWYLTKRRRTRIEK